MTNLFGDISHIGPGVSPICVIETPRSSWGMQTDNPMSTPPAPDASGRRRSCELWPAPKFDAPFGAAIMRGQLRAEAVDFELGRRRVPRNLVSISEVSPYFFF